MKGKDNQHLTPRQLHVIPHILASPTYEEAARRAQISSKPIYEWLQDPLFKKELSKKKNRVVYQALSFLKTATQKR